MFVDNSPPFQIGYQLTRNNLKHAPPGRIRVARFTTGFLPDHGLGYYSDTHLRRLVRAWKRVRQRRLEKYTTILCLSNRIPYDLYRYITHFL